MKLGMGVGMGLGMGNREWGMSWV